MSAFATVEEAVAAVVQPLAGPYCRIGGEAVTVTEVTVHHKVDQPVGTCTVQVEAPRPASLAINAEIEIEAGYAGATRRIFHGRIPNDEASITDTGYWVRVNGEGWASYLRYKSTEDIVLAGPISLKDAFRSLCELRGVPTYLADETTFVDGVTTIMLGGNAQIDGGDVVIDTRTSPLDWLVRTSKLFGYRVFDSPDGTVRLARISGLPDVAESVMTYTEGVRGYRYLNKRDVRPMVTYWEVIGASYTAADGGKTKVRSIPDEVPYDAALDPPGFAADSLSNAVLVTDTLAEGARNAHEVDYSEVSVVDAWDVDGHPALQPGDVVTIDAPTIGTVSEARWLTAISQSVSDRGYEASMEGWAGAGMALAAGQDCVEESIGSGVYHLGNQSISRYQQTAPDGDDVTINITVAHADYSSLRVTGIGHGSNSYNRRTPSTGSVMEVWQLPDPSIAESGSNEMRRVGSIELPTLDENSGSSFDYGDSDTYWTAFSLPISGSLKVGAAEVRLIAGENPDGLDDFEVKNLTLVTCGVGEPDLPGGGV